MIDILEFLHPYVPCHDPETTRKPVKVLSGGDYLTFERHKEARSSMQDARTPSSRLEGLIPKVEDFHNQAEWIKVKNFYVLYGCHCGELQAWAEFVVCSSTLLTFLVPRYSSVMHDKSTDH